MPEKDTLLDKAKVSAAAAAAIIAVLGGGGYTMYKDLLQAMPSQDKVAANAERIDNTIKWNKEEFGKIDLRQLASENRLQAQIDKNHTEEMHAIDEVREDVKNILSRTPRKLAGVK